MTRVSDSSIPQDVHFFSLIEKDEPFLGYHLGMLRRLPFNWHWHVIDGRHAAVPARTLDQIAAGQPHHVTLHRPPDGQSWQDRVAMASSAIAAIAVPCLLWHLQPDELWTVEQIGGARALLQRNPQLGAAYFMRHSFVGSDRVLAGIDGLKGDQRNEGLQLWRFEPGDMWLAQIPLRLCRQSAAGQWFDVAEGHALIHEETAAAGLVFQHYALASEAQAVLLDCAGDHPDPASAWRALQTAALPCRLSDYFGGVSDTTLVERVECQQIRPLATPDFIGGWRFDDEARPRRSGPALALLRQRPTTAARQRVVDVTETGDGGIDVSAIREIAVFRMDGIGDMVVTSGLLRQLRQLLPAARITLFCPESVGGLLAHCPYTSNVVTLPKLAGVPPDHPSAVALRQAIEQQLCGSFDLALNPRYAEDECCANLLMLATAAPLRVGFQQPPLFGGSYDANGCLTHILRYRREDHPAVTTTACLRAFADLVIDPRPEVWYGPAAAASAAKLVAQRGSVGPLCAIGLSASQAYRIWPAQNFLELCQRLWSERGVATLLLGSADDRALADQIASLVGPACLSACGRLSLEEVAAIFVHCEAFIGNDSGPKHIAAAAGLKILEIGWVPQGSPFGRNTGDLTRVATFGEAKLAAPQGSFSADQIRAGQSIAAVSVDQVLALAQDLMGGRR
jgi:ADP-heptose:LPS heptosyltransferase